MRKQRAGRDDQPKPGGAGKNFSIDAMRYPPGLSVSSLVRGTTHLYFEKNARIYFATVGIQALQLQCFADVLTC